ncbi:Opi1-domain-containing protein [Westerdykella ornata]|uniref:Opi1-domain-containing protein n=1 Tax=Westerdykella ornata TaxID=318751 RepID=A0A6A6JTU9_WESOR|nr:Opi1-domain-containing protein [Westerdykella ornata]KAF2280002.1 Opi1-domain-containing protein [Westerdykella ornata]
MDTQQQQDRPPAYTPPGSESLVLPSLPTLGLGSHRRQQQHDRLPSIKALDLPAASPAPSSQSQYSPSSVELSPRSRVGNGQWSGLPPLDGNRNGFGKRLDGGLRRAASNEMELESPADTGSVVSAQSEYGERREVSSLALEDPDVRLAAEALSGLCNPDFARSPSQSVTLPPRSPPVPPEPEPLLSLITSHHPWLAGTIHGSISAYNATKGYTPRFVQRGAEFIERNIGAPVVYTVSSVGRRTGVERNIRSYLGEHRRPSDHEQADSETARKRQRVMSPAKDTMDLDQANPAPRTGTSSRSSFAESLPAYDNHRSPNYEESVATLVDPATGRDTTNCQPAASQDRSVNWPTQLIMTTSGLGVALSDGSLRSLKACLGYLRGATNHIDSVMHALKLLLEEYESAVRNQQQQRQNNETGEADTEPGATGSARTTPTLSDHATDPTAKEDEIRQIADRMKSASMDIWSTLRNVTRSVSHYTGGTLPQNASQVVRLQLLSVPQRWRSAGSRAAAAAAAEGDGARGDEARGAQRMLAFAKEGLDMMGQITRVVDGTVTSAETWLTKIGRRPSDEGEAEGSGSGSRGGQGEQRVGMGEKHEFLGAGEERR